VGRRGNAQPELAHKSEQPRRRGQAVRLRAVGFAIPEKWHFLIPHSTQDIVAKSEWQKWGLKYEM